MSAIVRQTSVLANRAGCTARCLIGVVSVIALCAAAHAGPVTILSDDFESYALGANPGAPPIGQPWQISELAADGVEIAADPLDPANNKLLQFGGYRNVATAPFSAVDRQRILTAGNLTVSFDYYGMSSGGYSNYFDIGAYDAVSGEPAFFVRIAAQENQALPGFHDVLYLDPVGGLVDSGVDVRAEAIQSVTLAADLATETVQLTVEGSSAILPTFRAAGDVAEVQFLNYGIPMGSGTIDNLSITVMESEEGAEAQIPELSPLWLLGVGGVVYLGYWFYAWTDATSKPRRPGKRSARSNRTG